MKKSKKIVISLAIAIPLCIAVVWAVVSWQSETSSITPSELSLSHGEFHVSDDFYFTLGNPENLVEFENSPRRFYNNRIHLVAEPNAVKSEFEELAYEFNASITRYIRNANSGDRYTFTFAETFTSQELHNLANQLMERDIVYSARLSVGSGLSPTSTLPNDPRWDNWNEAGGNNWGQIAVGAPLAWTYREMMRDINVLVMDNGFYKHHEDLTFNNRYANMSQETHGTHVAGIIGAGFDDGVGISGMAPKARLYGFEVYYDICITDKLDVLQYYVQHRNVRVANFSMGFESLEFAATRGNLNAQYRLAEFTKYYEERLLEIINADDESLNNDFVFVTSAGNQYSRNGGFVQCYNNIGFRRAEEGELPVEGRVPAVLDPLSHIQNPEVRNRIIVVGAVDQQRELADFSQRGDRMDVSAPGVDIYSTWSVVDGVSEYEHDSGTSMSAPFVSGLATMLFGINPDFTGYEVKQIIVETAEGENRIINVGEAVRVAVAMADVGQGAIVGGETGNVGGGANVGVPTPPPSNFVTTPMVSTSGVHTVALHRDGTVWAWGSNMSRAINDSFEISYNSPMEIQNLNNIISISSGTAYTVALSNDGTVWALGGNHSGQLGDGTTTDRRAPVQVQGLNNITAIATGDWHYTVALRDDGTVWTWGNNRAGQLGNGTSGLDDYRTIPGLVQDLDNVIAIAASATSGSAHTIALRNDGTVWAWGSNSAGQLGDDTTTARTTPVQVQNLDDVTAVAAGGRHTVALRSDGTVWAWGSDSSGQLGISCTTRLSVNRRPMQVYNLDDVVAIGAGASYTMALRSDGTVWAWGEGLLGDGNGARVRRTEPVQILSLSNIVAIAADGSVAIRDDGTVWTWGSNSTGQLGNGTRGMKDYSAIPVQVLGFSGIGYLNLNY